MFLIFKYLLRFLKTFIKIKINNKFEGKRGIIIDLIFEKMKEKKTSPI